MTPREPVVTASDLTGSGIEPWIYRADGDAFSLYANQRVVSRLHSIQFKTASAPTKIFWTYFWSIDNDNNCLPCPNQLAICFYRTGLSNFPFQRWHVSCSKTSTNFIVQVAKNMVFKLS